MMHACGRGRPGQGAWPDIGMAARESEALKNHPPEEAELSRRGNGGAQGRARPLIIANPCTRSG